MKLESTLPQGSFWLHLVVFVDLIALVFALVFMSVGIAPKYGFLVKMPPSEFLINPQGNYLVVTVSAGIEPVIFFKNHRLEGGIQELKQKLKMAVDEAGPEAARNMTVILNMDQAVSRATEQQLIEIILKQGLVCAVANSPQ